MTIDRLTLHDFSVFRDVDLSFAKGINVFLGRNATGKTHVMKALYATVRAAGDERSPSSLDARLREKLARVFRPDTSPSDGSVTAGRGNAARASCCRAAGR